MKKYIIATDTGMVEKEYLFDSFKEAVLFANTLKYTLIVDAYIKDIETDEERKKREDRETWESVEAVEKILNKYGKD